MSHLLWEYQRPELATWVYLSSLLTIALFFVFHRVWSLRNLDLLLLLLLGPGLLLVHNGKNHQQTERPILVAADSLDAATSVSLTPGQKSEKRGFIWLFLVGSLFLIRLLLDPVMVRRPLLDPNLSGGGLAFLVFALLLFMMANVVTSWAVVDDSTYRGPGYPFLEALPGLAVSKLPAPNQDALPQVAEVGRGTVVVTKLLAIMANSLLIVGVLLVGFRHFNNFRAGLGVAVLYLLSPYTALMTGQVDHTIPAALLVWAVLMYRRPVVAGIFLGVAAGLVYYPLFLLPLWISFYWPRGLRRFGLGISVTLILMSSMLLIGEPAQFLERTQYMFGILKPSMDGLQGVWGLGWSPSYRIPLLTAFLILACSFVFWPVQKNLGTLLSCTGAIMVAAQFWHGFGGGLYIAWYLPLLLLTVFRPNLEDRIAIKVVGGRSQNITERRAILDGEAA